MALSGNGSSSGGGGSFAGNPNQQRRQPLGYLGPGTGLMTVSKTDSNGSSSSSSSSSSSLGRRPRGRPERAGQRNKRQGLSYSCWPPPWRSLG